MPMKFALGIRVQLRLSLVAKPKHVRRHDEEGTNTTFSLVNADTNVTRSSVRALVDARAAESSIDRRCSLRVQFIFPFK
jgi:hypothetical protein